MTQVSFNFPDDLESVKELIDAYENRKADGKATDISEPKTSISQNEDIFKPVEWQPDVESALKSIGLKLSKSQDGGSPSAHIIACKHNILGHVDEWGLSSLITALSVLKLAWPHGGQKWNWKIIKDVWYFCSRAEEYGYDIQIDKFASRLSKCVVSNEKFISESDFMDMISESNEMGLASLNRYNQSLVINRVPEEILNQEDELCL